MIKLRDSGSHYTEEAFTHEERTSPFAITGVALTLLIGLTLLAQALFALVITLRDGEAARGSEPLWRRSTIWTHCEVF